jgi:hypothetical protein
MTDPTSRPKWMTRTRETELWTLACFPEAQIASTRRRAALAAT